MSGTSGLGNFQSKRLKRISNHKVALQIKLIRLDELPIVLHRNKVDMQHIFAQVWKIICICVQHKNIRLKKTTIWVFKKKPKDKHIVVCM